MPQQFMLKRALQQCFVGLNYFYHNKHAIDFFCLPEKKVHKPSTVGTEVPLLRLFETCFAFHAAGRCGHAHQVLPSLLGACHRLGQEPYYLATEERVTVPCNSTTATLREMHVAVMLQ